MHEGFALVCRWWYYLKMKPVIAPEILENPLFIELMKEGLAIQDQFSAEPVYARTGKGCLKPSGVTEVAKSKKATRAKRS